MIEVFAGSHVTQPFGCTDLLEEFYWPVCPSLRFHCGIDLGDEHCGSEVIATRAGVVGKVGGVYLGPFAVWLVLDAGGVLLYGHLAANIPGLNDRVEVGGKVGLVGSLGWSTACHLHLEWQPGLGLSGPATAADPTQYLTGELPGGGGDDLTPDQADTLNLLSTQLLLELGPYHGPGFSAHAVHDAAVYEHPVAAGPTVKVVPAGQTVAFDSWLYTRAGNGGDHRWNHLQDGSGWVLGSAFHYHPAGPLPPPGELLIRVP